MNRRNFFKVLGTLAVSAVAAPLAKLAGIQSAEKGLTLRLIREYDPIRNGWFNRSFPVGSAVKVKFPQAFIVSDWYKQTELHMAEIEAEREKDAAFLEGDSWQS